MAEKVIHLDEIRDVPGHDQPETAPHSWQPANLIELAANPPEPPTIGGLLYPGKRTVLSGETESMKTWLALILAKAEMDAGLPVVWADLDAMGPGAMLERLQLLGATDQQIADQFLYIEPGEPLDPRKTSELADTVHERQIRLCVIDAFNPILTLHGLDPNAVTDVETFWRQIADPLATAGAAPVLLDHVVKNPDARGKYASGSERKASGAIVHLGFRLLEPLTKGGRGRTLLTVHKDRPGYLPRPTIGRLVLDATGDGITYTIEPDKSHAEDGRFRPTVLMEKVSVFLELHPGAATGNEIEKSVTGNAKALRTAIETLVEDGYVKREQGAKRAVLHTSIRPYREASEPPQSSSSSVRPEFVLNLKSSPVRPFVPPYGDEDDLRLRPQDEDEFVQPTPADGDPIREYDQPPIDETLIPYDLDEPAPNGHHPADRDFAD